MMQVLMDSGPLVAYELREDKHHVWSREHLSSVSAPFLTCEAVLTETSHLLRERGARIDFLWALLRRGVMRIAFNLETEFESVAVLMRRYAAAPMDLADACLVRMSELNCECRIMTLDGDFKLYRRFGRQMIPLICPV